MKSIPEQHSFSMRVTVTDAMTARFFGAAMHPLYATFALVEHGEYASRQAIRPFLDADEDAVGSAVAFTHSGAVPPGWIVEIVARVTAVDGRSIHCEVVASSREGEFARGTTTQRVVSKEKLRRRIEDLLRTE